jgi:lipopolysaccharide/colanic/teichoic acid biosynthesis glycosyltransferase
MQNYEIIKRFFDIFLSITLIVMAFVPIVIIAILVKCSSKGPVLYWSKRAGRFNQIFYMPKFRTMLIGTPTVATHLLNAPNDHLTTIGSFLRKSSLDELPQLWKILTGDMSFVGPKVKAVRYYKTTSKDDTATFEVWFSEKEHIPLRSVIGLNAQYGATIQIDLKKIPAM